jgi:3-dehydroquinate dehydratase-2
MRIGILNGPNLNLLGKRKPEIYGHVSFDSYLEELREAFPDIQLEYIQSNSEGRLIDQLHQWGFDLDGIVFNPAAYTHTSIAIADAVEAIESPVVEVHISNTQEREEFRKISFLREHCINTIIGKGLKGYEEAIQLLIKR